MPKQKQLPCGNHIANFLTEFWPLTFRTLSLQFFPLLLLCEIFSFIPTSKNIIIAPWATITKFLQENCPELWYGPKLFGLFSKDYKHHRNTPFLFVWFFKAADLSLSLSYLSTKLLITDSTKKDTSMTEKVQPLSWVRTLKFRSLQKMPVWYYVQFRFCMPDSAT